MIIFITMRKENKDQKKNLELLLCDPQKIEFFEKIGIDFVKVINNDINNDILVNKLLNSKIKHLFFNRFK